MADACVEGQRVVLQVSSTAAHNNLRPMQRMINELKPLGCRLSIGDFDSERRNLQLLEHIDTAFIKLRADLTEDLIADTQKQEDIRKIVEVTGPLGIHVIADEVTDTSSLAVLWQCGVKLIAGTFLSESSQAVL
jgi:EAL domain-containing protein (putative c-di-GMP-specific phosphodiesterase class I)